MAEPPHQPTNLVARALFYFQDTGEKMAKMGKKKLGGIKGRHH